MSQQAEWSAVRRRENGLRGQKPSQIILDGKYAVDISLSHTHTRTKPLSHTHFLSEHSWLKWLLTPHGPIYQSSCFDYSTSAFKGPAEVQVLCFKWVYMCVSRSPHSVYPSNPFSMSLLSCPECLKIWRKHCGWMCSSVYIMKKGTEQHTNISISSPTHTQTHPLLPVCGEDPCHPNHPSLPNVTCHFSCWVQCQAIFAIVFLCLCPCAVCCSMCMYYLIKQSILGHANAITVWMV